MQNIFFFTEFFSIFYSELLIIIDAVWKLKFKHYIVLYYIILNNILYLFKFARLAEVVKRHVNKLI